MARRLRQQHLYSLHPGMTKLVGSFTTTYGGAVSTTSFPGVTVTRTGTGAYTLSFDAKYLGVTAFTGSVQPLSGANDGYQTLLVSGSNTWAKGGYAGVNSTDGYAKIQVVQTSTAKDPPRATVYIDLSMKTSNVG